ncbi:TIGR03089 family protein [Streptomyces sp. WAC05374]|uniref:TIGR03089 family protein n=1 Tax=Streptomyces sp. WAC05374 TaxID=2487420 RepID=UPI000F862B8F|nr:TIGR03089 family protein [Streptomyces sp. WAC05374]RST11156.1 TIGR03089 family protein [Streptomyces sp. WAC05374]TDF46937.1 TIGR03089 family protein [Streptomyces sp. WAC05374]TDF57193.1 TIGR03089 family protein [Streptomyces sp. WAC05374]TDF61296.1 TIGR03089 family protein [Streptomyces sp. WAC05374]
MNASDRTPADLLVSALKADPSRPLVTYYDDATGERVELSVATFANWVAKTANLLQDALSAEPGERVALLLPAHWQTAVWLVACSSVGVVADVGGDPAGADHVVAGPDRLEEGLACTGSRFALSLAPLGRRFPTPPPGYDDYAVEVPSMGDHFVPYAPVDPAAPALAVGGTELSGTGIVERAAADARKLGLAGGARLLSGLAYDSWEGLSAGLYAPLASGASVVLCRNLDRLSPEGLAKRVESERITGTAV